MTTENPVTPSQTVGPFFHVGLTTSIKDDLTRGMAGDSVTIRGQVLDGDSQACADALVELWQADSEGRYVQPQPPSQSDSDQQLRPAATGFTGFGRVCTDDAGRFQFRTIKPGRVPGPGGTLQAPHIVVTVFARGLLKHLFTRVYFPDDPANDQDAVLQLVPPERRATLIARQIAGDQNSFEWDIVLQGNNETVFFDL